MAEFIQNAPCSTCHCYDGVCRTVVTERLGLAEHRHIARSHGWALLVAITWLTYRLGWLDFMEDDGVTEVPLTCIGPWLLYSFLS